MTKRFAAVLLLAAIAPAAHAGRPLATDDASVLEDKRCQVEAWIDRSGDATLAWLVPACNFGRGIEWELALARVSGDGSSRFAEAHVQAKWLWPLESQRWSIGAGVGLAHRPLQESSRAWDTPYAFVPVSFQADGYTAHATVGWLHDRVERRELATWGLALELPVDTRWTALAEAFGTDRERPLLRAGVRWAAVPGTFEVDLSIVGRPGGTRDERFLSLGVFWQSLPFLP